MRKILILSSLFLIVSCSKKDQIVSYPAFAKVVGLTKIATIDSIDLFNSGFGSGLSIDRKKPNIFYLVTDRGLNFWREDQVGRMMYRDSIFTPQIGRFLLRNDSLVLDSLIHLSNNNQRMPGRKRPFHTDDELIIDPEGLSVMSDGSFWIPDEQNTSFIHFDATGNLIDILKPGVNYRALPMVLSNVEYNKSFEGIAVSPSEDRILGLVQGILHNPDKSVTNTSRITRLIGFDLITNSTSEYLYLQEKSGHSNSDICAITDSTFLILERGTQRTNDTQTFKRIYKITINESYNMTSNVNKAAGRQFKYRTIEQIPEDKYEELGIRVLQKELILDLTDHNYHHNKPEGITVVNPHTIAISNDNDFGLTLDKDRNVVQKRRSDGKIDWPIVYFFKLDTPLYD
jgi:hypothetical protein